MYAKLVRWLTVMFLALQMRLARLYADLHTKRAAKSGMANIIVTFLMILVGLALTPTIAEQVTGVTGVGGNNLTGAALAIARLIPLFWVIILIGIGVSAALVYLKD